MNDLLNNLNEPQKLAVLHLNGPMVVFAGAGSGKTRAIITRIAYLISQGVRPWEILAVTFTNKAAGEMRQRATDLCPEAARCMITTFHSACSRWLREFATTLGFDSNFTIYDDGDSTALIKKIIKDLNPKGDIPTLTANIKAFIQNAKTSCILPDELHHSPHHIRESMPLGADHIYREYQKSLHLCNAMDFNDLLLNMLLLLKKHKDVRAKMQQRYKYVLVDEFQDTNKAQFDLIKIITAEHQNLFVVGDDDQSIYSWRGALPSNITDFSKVFPESKTVLLEQNYRCTSTIVDAANDLIKHNKVRAPKNLFSKNPAGELIELRLETDGEMEAYWVVDQIRQEKNRFKLDDIAIFYRTNSQSRALEELLTRENTPYTIFGSVEFYARLEIKDVLAYLKLIVNDADDVSFRRVVNVPPRGIGEKALAALEEKSKELEKPLYHTLKILSQTASDKSINKVANFLQLVEQLKIVAQQEPLPSLLPKILSIIEYSQYLKKKFPDQFTDKVENIYELGSAINDFTNKNPAATLTEWLQTVTLMRSEHDEKVLTGVSLMTLHMAKGLEYPRVYLVGIEDGLLPHHNSMDNAELLEEERRLLYVGITRAKQKLSLSCAYSRRMFNKTTYNSPSRFLDEIPRKYFTVVDDGQDYHKNDNPPALIQDADSDVLTYDYAENEELTPKDLQYPVGSLVYHPTYGKGIVKKTEEIFGKTKLIVDFVDFYEIKVPPSQLERLRSSS